jgi:hypothetical protein
MLAQQARSQQLIECLAVLIAPGANGTEIVNADAKMALTLVTGELMPSGKPDFLSMRGYTPIKMLVKHGTISKPTMMKLLLVLLKDFCMSMNVAHNMNEMQMIETAGMLLDECDDWRIEDYTMMFAMAKRGQLGKLMHTIDIGVISGFMDQYYKLRRSAGERAYEEEYRQFEAMELDRSERTPEQQALWSQVLETAKALKSEDDRGHVEERDAMMRESQAFWARQAQNQGINIDEIREQFHGIKLPEPKDKPKKEK